MPIEACLQGSGYSSSTNVDPSIGSLEDLNQPRGVVTRDLGASRDAPGSHRQDHGSRDFGFVTGWVSSFRDRRKAPGFGAGPGRRGQAPKGTGGMPRRHQMAGVEGRERSGGAAQRASIPEYPLETRGTETSQYPEEKKSTETPSVAASERGRA